MTSPDLDDPPSRVAYMRGLHPPPADVASDARLREWAFAFELPVSPAALWAVVSDTSRVNRALGLGEMQFEEREGVLHGSSRALGLNQRWVETPWSWVQDSHLTSLRRYSSGMAEAVFAAYRLEPVDGGRSTRFLVYFGWVPRGFWGSVLVRLAMRWLAGRYAAIVGELAQAGAFPRLPPSIPPTLEPQAAERLADLSRLLRERGLLPRAVDCIVELVTQGDELDLDRIAPLARARAFGVDEQALVEACLHATRVGLLDMRWDVVCPHCRGVRASLAHLGAMPTEGTCEVCAVVFPTSAPNTIEITFRPHPSIRAIEHRFYCSAEPATKRHIELQVTTEPGASLTVPTPLGPGRHRVRMLGVEQFGAVDVFADEPVEQRLEILAEAPAVELRAGPSPTLCFVGRADAPSTFVVETPTWPDTALRPGRVLSMQGFRDLFSEEYLAAGVQVEVGEQTILFTDIVGSTAFYAANGDPAAFSEVKAHFDRLFAIVADHRGAVVKTIGDATMAAFCSPVDAVGAAEAMQRAFPVEVRPTSLRIRVSLHTGSCIAVQFHQGIDYFGGTVNLAAKLQSLAHAGQVVLSQRTHDAPGVRALLESRGAELEPVEYVAEAIGGRVAAKRWCVG